MILLSFPQHTQENPAPDILHIELRIYGSSALIRLPVHGITNKRRRIDWGGAWRQSPLVKPLLPGLKFLQGYVNSQRACVFEARKGSAFLRVLLTRGFCCQ